MRGKVAKKLRKGVYNDMSPKKKEYKAFNSVKQIVTGKDEDGKTTYQNVNRATIICTGLRLLYTQAKKEYPQLKRS